MIKTFINTKNNTTIGVIENCTYDAVARIGRIMSGRHHIELDDSGCKRCEQVKFAKRLVPNANQAMMVDEIRATVACHGEDVFDTEVGKAEACKKVIKKHRESYIKALKRWQVAMLKDIMAVSPETFNEALKEVTK